MACDKKIWIKRHKIWSLLFERIGLNYLLVNALIAFYTDIVKFINEITSNAIFQYIINWNKVFKIQMKSVFT